MKKPLSPPHKIHIEGRLWLAADIHLGPHAPKTAAAFYDFLAQARTRADALILCGDIFEAWIGDDIIQTPPKWLKMAIQALQDCSQKTQLYLMQGNRDFLLRERFAQHVNAIWLPYEVIVKTHQTYFLLTHGDQYCTNDTHYLRYRRIVHQRWLQWLFLRLPLKQRKKIARSLRQRSARQNYAAISDINEDSALASLKANGLNVLIHGHTHRPALHYLNTQKKHLRIVIPDWDFDHNDTPRGGWVSIENKNYLLLHQIGHPTEFITLPASI